MRIGLALLASLAAAGCVPVIQGRETFGIDHPIPSLPPHGYVPFVSLVGMAELPAGVSVDATSTPRRLIGSGGAAAFLGGRIRLRGSILHFTGSVAKKDYHGVIGFLSHDSNVRVELVDERGERVLISTRIVIGKLPVEYESAWLPD